MEYSVSKKLSENLSFGTVILAVLTVLLIFLLLVLLTVLLILLIVLLIILLTIVILVLIKHSNASFPRENYTFRFCKRNKSLRPKPHISKLLCAFL